MFPREIIRVTNDSSLRMLREFLSSHKKHKNHKKGRGLILADISHPFRVFFAFFVAINLGCGQWPRWVDSCLFVVVFTSSRWFP